MRSLQYNNPKDYQMGNKSNYKESRYDSPERWGFNDRYVIERVIEKDEGKGQASKIPMLKGPESHWYLSIKVVIENEKCNANDKTGVAKC